MRTSEPFSGFRSVVRTAVPIAVQGAVQVAVIAGSVATIATILTVVLLAAGCGPTTPKVGMSLGGSARTDGGADTPRMAAPPASDAAVERAGSFTSGSGGAPACAPTVAGDGGLVPAIGDAGGDEAKSLDAGLDAGREAGIDSGAADARGGDDAAVGSGGRPGGAGGGTGGGASGGGVADASVATGGMAGSAASGGAAGGAAGNGGAATGASMGSGGAPGTGGLGSAGGAGNPTGGGGAGNPTGVGGAGGVISVGPAPGPGEIGIVELLINPAGTDTGREWIEVLNRTAHPISLVGLHVSDAANAAAVDFGSEATAALLPAGARMLLIQSADPTKNGGLTLGAGTLGAAFGTLVSLNNGADTISICVGPCGTGTVLDRVTWDASLGTGYDGHALVIDGARRCPAAMSFGDGGSFGTPGAANSPCP